MSAGVDWAEVRQAEERTARAAPLWHFTCSACGFAWRERVALGMLECKLASYVVCPSGTHGYEVPGFGVVAGRE